MAFAKASVARDGDHRGIVGAERTTWQEEADALGGGAFGEEGTEAAIGSDPAAEDEGSAGGLLESALGFQPKDLNDRLLVGGTDIGKLGTLGGFGVALEESAAGGLQAAETELKTLMEKTEGERKAFRISALREAVDGDTARISESEHLGGLVEGFSGSVVAGLS